jgi:hypothetical protein
MSNALPISADRWLENADEIVRSPSRVRPSGFCSRQPRPSRPYGVLCDRLGRVFGRLGLERRQRQVEDLQSYLSRRASESPEEVPLEEAAGAADMVSGLSDSGEQNERTGGLPTGNGSYPTGEDGGSHER